MTRSNSKSYNLWRTQTVNIIEPVISSTASLVLLTRKYFLLDKDIYSKRREKRIRDKWMRKLMKSPEAISNGLKCNICGREGLYPFTKDKDNLATLDHIISIRLGGRWNDVNNFQVACMKCNHKKDETKSITTIK